MRMHLAVWMMAIVFGFGGFSVSQAGVWTGGHGDIDAHLHDGELEVGLHFHDPVDQLGGGTIPAGHYHADEHQIFVAGPTIARPAGSAWDFAGNAGDELWFLPASSGNAAAQGKPYLGWSTDELDPSIFSDITFTLLSVNGPNDGIFSVFTESLGTPTAKLTSRAPMGTSSFTLAGGTHDHFFVAFNREGTYDVTLKVSAIHNSLGLVEGQGTFTFYAGVVPSAPVPEPSSMAVFGALALGAGYRARRQKQQAL